MKHIGNWGEQVAADFLRQKGYTIVATGYHTRHGEIDIISADDKFVVFVEVKTRKNAHFATAREFIDARKIEKIRKTAALWLVENETAHQPRFDVIELYAPHGEDTKHPKLTHLEDAFA